MAKLKAWSNSALCSRGRLRLKCDGTRAETRFSISAKQTSPFKSAGASVQSIIGSRGVRISGSNAGHTMFHGSVKGTGYPLHSPVSSSLPLPCVTVCHHISSGLYISLMRKGRLKGVPFRHLCEGFEENHATSQDSCCPCRDSNPVHPEYKSEELPRKPRCWMTYICKLRLIITKPTSNKPI